MIRSIQALFFAGLLSFGVQSAFAGGWISSGGGSFKDQHNPWFVRNTTEARYCVAIDSSSFSVSADQAKDAIRGAIQYWKGEFAKIDRISPSTGARVATQTFTEVGCESAPDIRFVLGYGKLASNEIEFFKDAKDPSKSVTNYIGVSVRTDYDDENLRGKGFVYISSDFGPHSYQNDGNLISRAWSKPHLLQYALIHEIGHVFGFPHTGSSIMSEVFLEQMLDQHLTELFQNNPIDSFLFPGPTVENCFIDFQAAQWFEAPMGTQCIQARYVPGATEIPVFARANTPGSQPTRIGTLKGIVQSALGDTRSRPGIFVHLTPKQKVFSGEETGFRSFVVGPSFVDFGAQANYVPANGKPLKSVYFRVTSTSFTISSNPNGKLGIIFSYESPIDLMLTQH